jgi:serine/threonine-protein kinase RIO1
MRFNARSNARKQRVKDGMTMREFSNMPPAEQETIKATILRAYIEKSMSMHTISAMGYPMPVVRDVCMPHKSESMKRARDYYANGYGKLGVKRKDVCDGD